MNTITSQHNDITRIDCIQKLKREIDQSVSDMNTANFGHNKAFLGYVFLIIMYTLSFWHGDMNLKFYVLCHIIAFLMLILNIYYFQNDFHESHDKIVRKKQEMQDLCDVLIHSHKV
jgi:hypothetical protein